MNRNALALLFNNIYLRRKPGTEHNWLPLLYTAVEDLPSRARRESTAPKAAMIISSSNFSLGNRVPVKVWVERMLSKVLYK
jgi:hypothetical protein